MKYVALFFLAGMITVAGQPQRSTNFRKSAAQPRPSSALVDPDDRVFTDLAAGGGWETIITFINMSGSVAKFTLTFYDDNGNDLPLPLLNPDGSVSRYSAIDYSLGVNTSDELVIPSVDKKVVSAWSFVSLSGSTRGIAAVAVVRYKDPKGLVIVEGTQALANVSDYDFFAPFDNLEGVATGLVLVNPGNTGVANVTISAQDALGNEILRDRFRLPAGKRTVITLPDDYPRLADSSGKLRVTSDVSTLAAASFRISPTGNLAYSPIFNWSGLFK